MKDIMVHSLFSNSKAKTIVCSLLLVVFEVFAAQPVSTVSQTQPILSFSINKDFITKTELVQQLNPLEGGTIPQEHANLIRNTVKGRNLMVVEDANGPAIIVTGIGPRYHSGNKAELEKVFGCPVLDVVDLLPIEGLWQTPPSAIATALGELYSFSQRNPNVARTMIRDTLFAYSLIDVVGLASLKPHAAKMSPTTFPILLEQFKNLKCLTLPPLNIFPNFIQSVSQSYVELTKISSSVPTVQFIDIPKTIQEMRIRLSELKTELGHIAINYTSILRHGIDAIFDNLDKIAKSPMIGNARLAIQILEGGDSLELIKNICSLKKQNMVADLSGIILPGNLSEFYALGHLLHSEPLAVYWYMSRYTNPSPYMYTQRGMCETCNPFVITSMHSLKHPILVISKIPASRPGRDVDIEIDCFFNKETFSLEPYIKQVAKFIVTRARILDNSSSQYTPAQVLKVTEDPDLNDALKYESETLDNIGQNDLPLPQIFLLKPDPSIIIAPEDEEDTAEDLSLN